MDVDLLLTTLDRCLSVARSHTLLSNPKNALALLAHALDLSSQSVSSNQLSSSSKTSGPPTLDVSPRQAESLQRLLEGLVTQHRALVELYNLTPKASIISNKETNAAPLIDNLDEYPANGVDLRNLVTYPPKIQPIPVKPLFFDIAWNYIEYPGRPNKAVLGGEKPGVDGEKGQGEQKKEGKRGWFGFGR